MAIKARIEKIEQAAKPLKLAIFTIKSGRANGHATWREGLTWANLSRREYEQLAADLKAEGVEVIGLNVLAVEPGGHAVDGWGQAFKV